MKGVAVVTGAASGIGRALVDELLARGATVAALDVDEAALGNLEGGTPWLCDVTDSRAVERVSEEIQARLGDVEWVFSNAGVATVGSFCDVPLADARWVLEVNLMGSLIVARQFLPSMKERGRGRLVFTASLAGLMGVPEMSVYSASKFAVVGLAESLRIELAGTGVGVTTICPGYVRTNLHRATRYHSPRFEHFLDDPPSAWGLRPEQVARRAIDAALCGRGIVPMGIERVGAVLARLSPDAYSTVVSRVSRMLSTRSS